MTKEQIVELRRISDEYVKLGDDEPVAFGSDVRQLLDEREALLEALRAAVDALEVAGEGRFHQDALRAARDAIAKAEAE